MSAFEQLQELTKNVKNIHCAITLQAMNLKARELQEEIEKTKQIRVDFNHLKN